MDLIELKPALEAILFANGNPVSSARIAETLELTVKQTQELISILIDEYSSPDRGLQVLRLEDNVQMVTKKEHSEKIRRVMELRRNTPLSQAAIEVLAVIAYNQPVTKAFIEQVRGVDCSAVIGNLVVKNLVEERGRLEIPGRPLLYGTTDTFLRCFGVESLKDLPELPEESGFDSDKPHEMTEQGILTDEFAPAVNDV